MTADIQVGGFSHAKCFNCGHVGKIEAFPMEKTNHQKTDVMEFYIPVYSCPLCTAGNCEPLYPNEMN